MGWWEERQRQRSLEKQRRNEAQDAYERVLAEVELHQHPQEVRRSISRVRARTYTGLKKRDRRRLERKCAWDWLLHALYHPEDLSTGRLGRLEALIGELDGKGAVEEALERVDEARQRHGMPSLAREAEDGYERALTAIDVRGSPDEIDATITRVRRESSKYLKRSDRRRLEREWGYGLLEYAVGEPDLLAEWNLAGLDLVLAKFCGERLFSDWIYEKVMLARLHHGMWPLPRNTSDLLMDPGEQLLLAEPVSDEVEVGYEADPETGEPVLMVEERTFQLEVTTRRFVQVTDVAHTTDLNRLLSVRVEGAKVIVTRDDTRESTAFLSSVPDVIRATLVHARQQGEL